MAVSIGGRLESDYSNPLGMLSDCHRRIERFLDVLLRVSRQARGGALNEEYRNAFATSLRYFREAAPKHTSDEEESLFPRLRESSEIAAQRVMHRLDDLRRDHSIADQAHRAVDALGNRWLEDGQLSPEDARTLTEELGFLRELYQRHIAIEDMEIFPLARKVINEDEINAIAREMAARRGLHPGEPKQPDHRR